MSDDPETRRQIAELARDNRPLLVLDVDEVILEFVAPFSRYLDSKGNEFRSDSFRLHGNVFNKFSGEALEKAAVSELLENFFGEQEIWQKAADGAAEALASLSPDVEIVLLTSMPHRHRNKRRRLLDTLGFPFPLLTTETPKGPAIRQLRGATGRPVAFVDDIPSNLMSVYASLPEAHLFHLMAFEPLRKMLPPLEQYITLTENWNEAQMRIAGALGV